MRLEHTPSCVWNTSHVFRAGRGGCRRDGDRVGSGVVVSRLGKFEASSGVLFGCGFGGVWRAFSLVRFEKVNLVIVFSCVQLCLAVFSAVGAWGW